MIKMLQAIIFFIAIAVTAQSKSPIDYNFEIGADGKKFETSLNSGRYNILFYKNHNVKKIKTYNIKTVITTEPISNLEIDDSTLALMEVANDDPNIRNFKKFLTFKIQPRTKVEISIQEVQIDDTIGETYTYIFNGIPERKWVTSFGLAGAYLLESQTYRTVAENGAFRIVPDGNQKLIEAIPVVQFSYLNIKNDNGFAWTGGLGFDTENLSAFAGGSYYVGHNLLLTAGFALHKQNRRSNRYSNNQIVPEALEFNVLNEQYYRVNPFISLTFVMNRNFLKK